MNKAIFIFPIKKAVNVPKNPIIINGPPIAEATVLGNPRLGEFMKLAYKMNAARADMTLREIIKNMLPAKLCRSS